MVADHEHVAVEAERCGLGEHDLGDLVSLADGLAQPRPILVDALKQLVGVGRLLFLRLLGRLRARVRRWLLRLLRLCRCLLLLLAAFRRGRGSCGGRRGRASARTRRAGLLRLLCLLRLRGLRR